MALFRPEIFSQIMDAGVFHMSPPAIDLVDDFFAIRHSLEWKRVGVITDSGSQSKQQFYSQYPSQERNTVFLDLTELQMKGRRNILNALKDLVPKLYCSHHIHLK